MIIKVDHFATESIDDSLALSFQILAVKSIVEAPGVVALRVALAVVEVAPTLQRGRAVLPRVVEVERAVAVVPAACVVVAQHVTHLVVLALLALGDLAGLVWCRRWRRRHVVARPARGAVVQDVAPEAVEVGGADAAIVRRFDRVLARARVVTGIGFARAVAGVLALGSCEGRRAQTLGTFLARDAGAAVVALEAAASVAVVITCGASESLFGRDSL